MRKDCTEAPRCWHCLDRDHPPSRCRNRNKPVQFNYKSAYEFTDPYSGWDAEDMPIDDFEIHREPEPVLQGSITSAHAPGGALAAPKAPQTEMMEVVPATAVQATGSGSPAVIQTSVPPSVSIEPILGKRAPTAIDSSGFQMVTKKQHRGAPSISIPRPSPYDPSPRRIGEMQRRLSTSA